MRVDPELLERLEWQRVLDAIARDLRTAMGVQRCRDLRPRQDPSSVERELARVEEMRRLHGAWGRLPIGEIKDPAEAIRTLRVARRDLLGEQIYSTVQLLAAARDVVRVLRQLEPEDYDLLGAEWARFPDLGAVVDSIEGNLTPGGEVEDSASAELARLRREIRQLSGRLTGVLDKLIKAEWTEPVLRDRFITIRNDRFVVPVRTDTPRRFHGIVHGRSSTEKTLFVEPIETVEINNALVRLKDEEQAEVERILSAYTEILRGCREEIVITADVLGEIDLLEAVASWSDRMKACQPEFGQGPALKLVKARHPVLEITLAGAGEGQEMVPLDVDLPAELRVLIISGPNAGGKTVALKTIGLLVLMAHAGLPVPAEFARLPAFGMMIADIGDEQSIEDGLSTFSSHIRNLARMLETAEAPALVLIDEIGTGTDPAEGAALGAAALDRLRARGVHVVATTHHQAIKTWAYRSEGVLNAACEFDDSTLRPTYRLVPGVAGASIGLTMAEQLGLDPEVVADARKRLDPAGEDVTRALESVRSLASDLEIQRSEVVTRRRELERNAREESQRLQAKETRRQERWDRKMEDLMRSFRQEAARMIGKIKDSRDRRIVEKERSQRERELKDRFSEEMRAGRQIEPAPEGWSPQEGESVLLVSFGKTGTVRGLRQGKVEVLLGRSVFTVAPGDLRPVAGVATPAASPNPRRPFIPEGVSAQITDKSVPFELHLIGFRIEEGIRALEKYLDDAMLAGLLEVRVVHGLGTGRLRRAIRERLDDHEEVVDWREAGEREGGGGATVVTLRSE